MRIINLMGSGEFTPWALDVDRWCLEHATSATDRVLVLPTASAAEGEDIFRRWGDVGTAHYESLGAQPEVVDLRTRADAESESLATVVEGARLVFFSGGNPGYLADVLRDTPFWAAVLRAVAGGTALGGCSAGAAAFGVKTFWVGGDRLDGWMPGLGLLSDSFVLPHFDALDSYQPGLRRTMLQNRPPGSIVIGIDEDTALYGDDGRWNVGGKGAAWTGERGTKGDDLTAYRDGDTPIVRLGLPVG